MAELDEEGKQNFNEEEWRKNYLVENPKPEPFEAPMFKEFLDIEWLDSFYSLNIDCSENNLRLFFKKIIFYDYPWIDEWKFYRNPKRQKHTLSITF